VEHKNILVYGYGNPGRQDDGLGPALAEKIERLNISGVVTDSNYQLNIEDALEIAKSKTVFFTDASVDCDEPFVFKEVVPSNLIRFTTHTISPDSLMALCNELYGTTVPAYILAIRGYGWEFNEPMTDKAENNMRAAYAFLVERLTELQ
jgi:hydrogenase maturation protease